MADVKRINVAVNAEEVAALERLIEKSEVSLTEAVRRLIAYGDHVHRAVVDDGATLYARWPDGTSRALLLDPSGPIT